MKNLPEHLHPFVLALRKGLIETFNESLLGAYIHGSLTYGGYVRERSDVDILAICKSAIDDETKSHLSEMICSLSDGFPHEAKNTELDVLFLKDIQGRSENLSSLVTYAGGVLATSQKLDGYWIELTNTRNSGIPLCGALPSSIIPKTDAGVLIRANKDKFSSLQNNAENWERINLWNQTYILVQACRVLYSLNNKLGLVSKQEALAWAGDNVPDQFAEMLRVARAKLDTVEGPREKIISENWRDFFAYIESKFAET